MPKKPKFYGVRCGRTLGVFTSWKMCEASTKGWPNAKHKSFPSRAEAEAFSAAGGHEPAAAAPRSEGGARSADAASPSFAVGASCVLRGLVGGAKHNGKCVDVIVPLGRDAAHPFRVRVRLPCGDLIAVKPQNLEACAAAKPKNSTRGYFGGSGGGPSPPLPKNLDPEQRHAVDLATDSHTRHSIFLTGVAGTGKSRVIEDICALRSDDLNSARLVVVASTGVAALNVNGQTLHKFAGCGVPRTVGDFQKMWAKKARERWRTVDTLIFDEISMTSGTFLDELSKVVTAIRAPSAEYGGAATWRPNLPFGGIQLILTGDFLQLPPVFAGESTEHVMRVQAASKVVPFHDRGFAFESVAWKAAKLITIELKTNHRADNQVYAALLQKIRIGQIDDAVMSELQPLTMRKTRPDNIVAMKLVATNRESSVMNADELEKLDAMTHVYYEAIDAVHPVDEDKARGARNPRIREELLQSLFWDQCLARKTVSLRLDASVMLLKNHHTNKKLVNGSQGTVTGFKRNPVASGDDAAGVDHKLYPVVSFAYDDDGKTRTIEHHVVPETFDYVLPCFGTCVRTQVPLKLAWASTTHKAQGLSITYVDIDLKQFFADGQACTFPSLSFTRAPLTFLTTHTHSLSLSLSSPLRRRRSEPRERSTPCSITQPCESEVQNE